jgi:geranylgeranyl diphosphate synthase, type II
VDLQATLAADRAVVDAALERWFPAPEERVTRLADAMQHALANGKRVRPFLVRRSAAAFGLDPDSVLPTACGVEMMHCATLVHDDLPCIDNSDLRHGRAACHVAYDEPTALLAADALIIMAFECLARQAAVAGLQPERCLQCVRELADFTGVRGLVAGELLDIEAEHRPVTESELEFIHLNKTAKLIMCSVRAGAILAGASEIDLQYATDYARNLGLLFQITDDLLDVEGDVGHLGKPVGADASAGKATYPSLLGLAETRRRAVGFAEAAGQAAAELPEAELWQALAEFILHRKK